MKEKKSIWWKQFVDFFGMPKSEARKLGEQLMSDPTTGRALVEASSRKLKSAEDGYARVRINGKIYKMRELG